MKVLVILITFLGADLSIAATLNDIRSMIENSRDFLDVSLIIISEVLYCEISRPQDHHTISEKCR